MSFGLHQLWKNGLMVFTNVWVSLRKVDDWSRAFKKKQGWRKLDDLETVQYVHVASVVGSDGLDVTKPWWIIYGINK